MKAIVTSTGEPTTDLCVWQLKRLGFQVQLVKNKDSLGNKLHEIYNSVDEDFIRVDADVIVNKNVWQVHKINKNLWWVQFKTFDMYKLDLTNGGVQYISKKILPILRDKILAYAHDDRPETRMFRLDEFKERWRFKTVDSIAGIHGFGQKDLDRVKSVKDNRKNPETYDWLLAEKMQEFYK